MSSIYRIHGARFLRKYTAADRSSIYAYMSDVKTIANTLCKVPWTRVANDIPATTTIHTEEGLDWNEPERDRFDAAEWCGEHSNGFHRAFAQAACYVFKMPTSAIGKSIQKLGIQVTSDAYNPYGARIAAMTSATLNIPMDCDTVRQGEVFRAPDDDGMGAAPRLFMRNANGSQTWYANTELVELTPQSTMTAKQYLFVFVCLENYNRGRDGWIEGSSYIDNDIELTLSAAASDLVPNELNDLSQVVAPVEFPIVSGGILPDMNGSVSGVVAAIATDAGTVPEMSGEYVENIRQLDDETSPANCYGGIRSVYAMLERGAARNGEFGECHVDRKRIGVGFTVKHGSLVTFSDSDGNTSSAKVVSLSASSLFVPFSLPAWKPSKVVFDWNDWLTGKTITPGTMFSFYLCRGSYVTDYEAATLLSPAIYRGEKSVGPYELVGRASVSDGSANFPVDMSGHEIGTFLVCAYLPQENVSNSASAFSVGAGGLFYDYYTPGSILGGEIPAYSRSGSYSVGDMVRVGYDSDFVSFASGSAPGVGLCCLAGSFIRVREDGRVVYSSDGVSWKESNLTGISAGSFAEKDGVVVLCNSISSVRDRNAYVSRDGGKTWTSSEVTSANTYLTSVVRFGSNFYCEAASDAVYASPDGVSWHSVKTIGSSVKCTLQVANGRLYCGGRFVSTDGTNWTNVTGTASVSLNAAVYYRNKFWISSLYLNASADGVTFSDVGTEDMELSGMYVLGSFLVCTDRNGGIWISTDGNSWSHPYQDVTFYEIVEFEGDFYAATSDGVYISKNGNSWAAVAEASGLRKIAAGNGRIVSIGSSSSVYSKVVFGKVYQCVVANSGGVFDTTKWSYVGEPSFGRCSGADDLCVPDITLIG